MELVIIESPYAGDTALNIAYAQAAMLDCINRGEAPFASHLLYTQNGILNDNESLDRALGIDIGLKWAEKAHKTVVYKDLGISPGMTVGISHAVTARRSVEYRTLDAWKHHREVRTDGK